VQVIEEFDALGVHRTGSPGDDATTRWMIARLDAVGVRGEAHHFSFPRLVTDRAELVLDGRAIAGHAQMDAGLTPAAGRHGPLWPLLPSAAPPPGAIAVIDLADEAQGAHLGEGIDRAVAAGAAGCVVVARRGAGSFFITNAPHLSWPAPIPVLLIPPAESEPVIRAARDHERAQLFVSGMKASASATNVVAWVRADAPQAEAPPIGVMTPKSGWWHCAAERGGGLAVWLACAEATAMTAGRRRDALFLFTAGHELGHAGLEAYLLEHPEQATTVDPWVHLGASIGAAAQPSLRVFASDETLLSRGRAALDAAGAGPYRAAPAGVVSGGEARNISARGGRFLSLAGGHAYFHHPEDRPDKVDPASVGRYAVAMRSLMGDLVTAVTTT